MAKTLHRNPALARLHRLGAQVKKFLYGLTPKGLAAPLPGKAPSWNPVPDPEGPGGRHAALDWFAPKGTKVVVPEGGRVIEARYDARATGQVFGGTVKVKLADGRIWVFRHTNPAPGIRNGMQVAAGTVVGLVAPWDGSTHSHIELWRTEAGGYELSNMINPLDYLGGGGDPKAKPEIGEGRSPSRVPRLPDGTCPPGYSLVLGTCITKDYGDVGDPIDDTVDAVVGKINPFDDIGQFIHWVGGNWDRILEVIGGFLLLLLGLYRLASQLGTAPPAPGIVKAAAGV